MVRTAVGGQNENASLACLDVGDGLATGAIANVYVSIWRGIKTPARANREAEGFGKVRALHPRNTLYLCVVEPTTSPPDEAMRRAAVEMLRAASADFVAVAAVVEGDGFKAAMVRGVLTAMQRFLGFKDLPVRYFGDVHSAAAWLACGFCTAPGASIARATEELRSALTDEATNTLIRARVL
ncbi:MAG: hypothetical protein RL385_3694 [Pseudomonadota bacterium]|jgi:hypothetical protein